MRKNRLDIIFEDKNILVVNKPSNLLTIATDNEKENTLFHQVYGYVKKKNQSVYIVHRLDRDTSGIVLFAKNTRVKNVLQDNWDKMVKTRGYMAVVSGKTEENGSIKSWLKETSTLLTYSSSVKDDGKLAITKYKKVGGNSKYSLLSINILTGRKNQIRVHMSDIGHPIVGDKKYGSKVNPIRRMALHANVLEIEHPVTHQMIRFESKVPKEFMELCK